MGAACEWFGSGGGRGFVMFEPGRRCWGWRGWVGEGGAGAPLALRPLVSARRSAHGASRPATYVDRCVGITITGKWWSDQHT